MTHSQQPSMDTIQYHTELLEKWDAKMQMIWWFLKELKKEIEQLPQSPSVESLLEEMGASMHQMRDWSRDWKAYIQLDNFDTYHEAYWKTPILALLALKEKLNNNNQ